MSSTARSLSPEAAANMEAIRRQLSGLGQKLAIDILIKNGQSTYTTLDRVEGTISITALKSTSFDDIEILFVGVSTTSVERITAAAAVSGRSEAYHQFLKLQDKSVQDAYPEDRMLEAGKTYQFPFLFVVPEQLLPKVCGHACKIPSVREAHLHLPPTMGDHECDSKDPKTNKTLDDFVPEMVSTRYGVHVRVSNFNDDGTRERLAHSIKQVRVIPTTPEQPPLPRGDEDSPLPRGNGNSPLPRDDKEYCYRKEKVIRKGVLQGKAGTLVMQAMQPPPIRMHARGDSSKPSVAKIMLRFDPADRHASSPRLGNLATKLKINTYYASTARQSYPNKQATIQDPSQGIHSEQLNLAHRKVSDPQAHADKSHDPELRWTEHSNETTARRDSATSTSMFIPDASKDYKGGTFYVAQLDAPIILPDNKAFVPTFHSCLISRIYQVKFELHLQNKGVVGTIDLKLPVQIASTEDGGNGTPRRCSSVITDSSCEEGIEDLEIPSEAFLGVRRPFTTPISELPPSYSYYAHSISGQQPVPAY